uniref:Chemosensory protein n=2 Tax=Neoptera TaxID=33340 RepID=A0A6M9BJU6_9NEOP|nr:chemosensory protein [Histia rhodope]
MRFILVAFCVLVAVLADEKYKTQENFNVSELLDNDRLLVSYIKCLLDQGPCTASVKDVKDKIPEVLSTTCAKCTDQQIQIGKTLIQEVKKRHPDLWNELTQKYDRNGEHRRAFHDVLQTN